MILPIIWLLGSLTPFLLMVLSYTLAQPLIPHNLNFKYLFLCHLLHPLSCSLSLVRQSFEIIRTIELNSPVDPPTFLLFFTPSLHLISFLSSLNSRVNSLIKHYNHHLFYTFNFLSQLASTCFSLCLLCAFTETLFKSNSLRSAPMPAPAQLNFDGGKKQFC